MTLYTKENDLYRVATTNEVLEHARREVGRKFQRGKAIRSPSDTEDFLRMKLAHSKNEQFVALWLDNRHRLLKYDEMFQGTVDGTSVYPRVVVQRALAVNAAAVIFAHPHPSGVSEPSQADERITKRLKESLALIDVRVLDHIVVGKTCVSLASRGIL